MNEALNINSWALAGLYLLFIIPLFFFQRWQLGLSKNLISAVVRMTLQLAVVGLYLQTLFAFANIWLNTLWLLIMILVASGTICKQASASLKQLIPPILAGQLLAMSLVLPVLMIGVIQAEPWWKAQYLIPVAGMLLGNALSANVLALERLLTSLKKRHAEYQFYVALGAPNPSRPFLREALTAALRPPIAAMSTLGIVSLPGMMTGQILGGTEPLLAVKYQLVIMVAIFISVFVSAATTLYFVSRRLFNRYGQLTSESRSKPLP
ncbi:permease [Enterovibrio norvegicus FF-33]|uniref:Permease n=1 Tax=Enterovibrio norvegicus FF-454 TaxID=1185651 RepID=A0A1E5C415_9GAMM|nr:ABC transporter permease [Enterovibrio norvegicus]OEE60205.1 permease [Enterovibrio norvegicus FF-454]OEE66415.1 permease [Enterovibrio norvegicus FF-33]OEE85331.1 permease [Enterovibrio norvegicus FF-162]